MTGLDSLQLGDFAVHRKVLADFADEDSLLAHLRDAGFIVAGYDVAPSELQLYQESAYAELFIVVSGQVHFYGEGKTAVLSFGDAFTTKAQALYGYQNKTEQPARMLVCTKTL